LISGITVKRYDHKFLQELAKGLEQTCWKASGNHDNATTVGVYEILPTNCMRKAYYYKRKKLVDGMSLAPRPIVPYIIRGKAVEAAIVRMMLFAHAATTTTGVVRLRSSATSDMKREEYSLLC
jgi:hypothetical protein